jgi:hypothetical protein
MTSDEVNKMTVEEVNAITEPSFTSEPLFTEKPSYWKLHKYHRLSVEDFVEEFCGWPALKELIDYIHDEVKKAFFITMFLTGGRVTEVLSLCKRNFEILENEDVIKVTQMRLLKRYKKIDSYPDPITGKPRWHTQKQMKFRKTFTIKRQEPFTKVLERYLDRIDNSNALLFPSPSFHHRNFNKAHGLPQRRKPEDIEEHPFTRQWAYLTIREVNKKLPEELKARLGLNKVWYDEDGKKIADEIHLWLHWFRSQRASGLVSDYGFEVVDLVAYFDWKDMETALRYAKKGWRGLTEKMNKVKVHYT